VQVLAWLKRFKWPKRALLRCSAVIVFIYALLIGCTELDSDDARGNNSDSLSRVSIELICDAAQTQCVGDVDGMAITLSLHQPALPPLTPLTFSLDVSGQQDVDPINPAYQKGWIEGRDMFMGEHALQLAPNLSDFSWLLSGTIPVCVTGHSMVWRLNVELLQTGQLIHLYADLRSQEHE